MTIESLLAYEFAFEEAAAEILKAHGFALNLDFVNDKPKKAPYIDDLTFLAEPTGTRINVGPYKIWHVWRGTLTTRFVVARGDKDGRAQLKLMVGGARLEYQLFDRNFNQGPHLPYHFVNDMVESVPSRGHIGDQKHDWIELRHLVTLNIRPSALEGLSL